MKSKRIFSSLLNRPAVGLLFLGFSILTSCATFYLPKPQSDYDTLLVISTETDFSKIGGTTKKYMEYLTLEIKNYNKKITIKANQPLTIVAGLKPGKYNTTSITRIPDLPSNYVTGLTPKPQLYNVVFEVKPRQLTIFPAKFIYYFESYGSSVTTGWNATKIDEADKQKVIGAMKEDKNFSLWINESFRP